MSNDKPLETQEDISLNKSFVNLPEDLEVFEKLIKECAQKVNDLNDKEKHGQCIAILRCIPHAYKDTWDKLTKDLQYNEWLTLDINLENISTQGFIEAINQKNQEDYDHQRLRQAKCLVQAHEKQFLFFGTL